jgi:hypothetical protein
VVEEAIIVKPRNTLILVAVAVALVVYAFWVESPLTSEQLSMRQGTPTATPFSYLFKLNVADVQTIVITDLRYPRVVSFTRDGTGWRVTSPLDKPADNNKANGTASTLSDLRLFRVIQTNDLARYGLAPARIEARVIMKDGTAYGLLIGNATSDGSLYYATYTGETSRVFLVEPSLGLSLQNLLDQPPFEIPTPTPAPTETPAPTATPTPPGFVPTLLPATTPTP